MIQFRIFLIRKDPRKHGPGFHSTAGNRRINRVIHQPFGVCSRFESAESQVIVPWDHGKLSVLFVQIVIVDH